MVSLIGGQYTLGVPIELSYSTFWSNSFNSITLCNVVLYHMTSVFSLALALAIY